jgi:diguanylate cyclase (GGDEF)-like protein
MSSEHVSAQPAERDKHLCCSMTSVLLALVREQRGTSGVAELLAQAGCPHEETYLENIENWVSLDEACALLEAGARITGDEAFARRVGAQTLRQHAGTQVATMMRSLGSPEAIYKAVAQASSNVSTVSELQALEVAPGRVVVSVVAREGFTRRRAHCDWTTGLLSGPPILFGLPPAQVQESECAARGAERCLYTITWNAESAAADPQERITAMEAQLTAMSRRLQSAYATASDLISTERLDTVLQRIVERAADAVRAPGYILAVRGAPELDTHVYHHGLDAPVARSIALQALEGSASATHSILAVDVASRRRAYGKLIACYPGAIEFSLQEREMLSLYAKHAAAVLDMATALDESAHRHEQVSSLLSLSQALAQAGTSEEVAERLAAAVPEVVDCDGMAVWLWEEDHARLRSLASWSHDREHAAHLRGLSIGIAETPLLGELISTSRPMFFEATSEDAFIGGLMETLDIAASAVVPIVARNGFRGALSVSVTRHPERLRPNEELLEQLTGVAALAATAIENGRLVDKLHHRASHDGLTGLLNRVGFRQRMDAAIASAEGREQAVGLLFVDLDDFKQVNDRHSHEMGDELLRQAADRLAAISREEDGVARLGGDEFAIVLSSVSSQDQLRAAERRVHEAFHEPFQLAGLTVALGASVGGAIWPEHGQAVSRLVQRADAAMYRDKAEGRLRRMRGAGAGARQPLEI